MWTGESFEIMADLEGETYVMISNSEVGNPTSYEMAMNDVDVDQWKTAMVSEMESMYSNQVWDLTDVPEGVRPIGSKWIYKRKRGPDGHVKTCKARLVTRVLINGKALIMRTPSHQ